MASLRTRFSPSPTGFLHLGGARTALFNWLFARHYNGTFILRIEDTDVERSQKIYEDDIIAGLTWLGLDWDEGPYRQTERLETYRFYTQELIARGAAYYCNCPKEGLEQRRQAALARGEKPRYDGHCRDLGLKAGSDTAVRFRSPTDGITHWDDLTKGAIAFDNAELDDLVLVRADGVPTYNFAVVVDDLTMNITHVIRGDDHISNTPRQILIYQALGAPLPQFAHIPMILGPDRAKLSKRHGALSVLAYRDMGYLPDTMVNFLARLGWSHGDQEIFSREELIRSFSLDHVGKAPGIFDTEKLAWLNGHYLRQATAAALAPQLQEFLSKIDIRVDDLATLANVARTLQPRAHTLVDMAAQARFYFEDPRPYEDKGARKFLTPQIKPVLREIIARWQAEPVPNEEALHQFFKNMQEEAGLKIKEIAQAVRLALTGRTASPGLFEIIEILGWPEVFRRLRTAVAACP
ncbi:glutamate--tRNA ligase [Desulfobacca acetoxidans]